MVNSGYDRYCLSPGPPRWSIFGGFDHILILQQAPLGTKRFDNLAELKYGLPNIPDLLRYGLNRDIIHALLDLVLHDPLLHLAPHKHILVLLPHQILRAFGLLHHLLLAILHLS